MREIECEDSSLCEESDRVGSQEFERQEEKEHGDGGSDNPVENPLEDDRHADIEIGGTDETHDLEFLSIGSDGDENRVEGDDKCDDDEYGADGDTHEVDRLRGTRKTIDNLFVPIVIDSVDVVLIGRILQFVRDEFVLIRIARADDERRKERVFPDGFHGALDDVIVPVSREEFV